MKEPLLGELDISSTRLLIRRRADVERTVHKAVSLDVDIHLTQHIIFPEF